MAMPGSTDLDPTWYGVLVTDCDALLLLEKCLTGELAHIQRRPHDSERARLIKSGSIFVYESNASGIKRWTDGINWSPSRILTNFLVYHELEKAPPPGEKKRAMKRKRSEADLDEQDVKDPQRSILEEEWTDDDRRLMGSPQDNYGWKTGGLVKKTYSFDFRGASHHIISYFNPEDVRSGELKRPIHCEEFSKTFIRLELIDRGARSRNPISEAQIEQQRWERPLYQNDSTVTLMRQYPPQMQMPYSAPAGILDYHSALHRHAPSHHHHHGMLGHRSSIQFPLEENPYHQPATPSYQQHLIGPQPMHPRHSSVSIPVDPYGRTHVRDGMVLPAPAIDTLSESSYHTNASALHHARSQPSLNPSPIGVKQEAVYDDDESHSAPYDTLAPPRGGFSVASPISMPSLDTVFSHAIARPAYSQTPQTTTQIIGSPQSHYSPQSVSTTGPPPAKKSRIESSYSSFTPVTWEQSASTPVTAAEIASNHSSGGLSVHFPTAPFHFPQSMPSSSNDHYAYSHASAPALYSNLGEYGVSQWQNMFMTAGYSPQLTAPS